MAKTAATNEEPMVTLLPTPPAGTSSFARHTKWITLPEELGADLRFEMWMSYPQRIRTDLTSGETERATPALLQVCLQHSGWRGSDGELLPPMNTVEFWESPELPDEVGAEILCQVLEAPRTHPFLGRTRNGR